MPAKEESHVGSCSHLSAVTLWHSEPSAVSVMFSKAAPQIVPKIGKSAIPKLLQKDVGAHRARLSVCGSQSRNHFRDPSVSTLRGEWLGVGVGARGLRASQILQLPFQMLDSYIRWAVRRAEAANRKKMSAVP